MAPRSERVKAKYNIKSANEHIGCAINNMKILDELVPDGYDQIKEAVLSISVSLINISEALQFLLTSF